MNIKRQWIRKIFYSLLFVLIILLIFNAFVYYHTREKSCSESPGSLYSAPHWVYKAVEEIISFKSIIYLLTLLILPFLIILGFLQESPERIMAGILIVILIVMILPAFQGARGRCRDCERIHALEMVKSELEIYYQENGKYPGVAGSNQWRELQKALEPQSFHDPCYQENPEWDFEYWVSSNSQKYVLKANFGNNNFMEHKHRFQLDDDIDGNALGAFCGENGPQEREYCTSPYFK